MGKGNVMKAATKRERNAAKAAGGAANSTLKQKAKDMSIICKICRVSIIVVVVVVVVVVLAITTSPIYTVKARV